MKILITGSPGAGKTTLAKEMETILGIPAIHLDAIFWKPNWIKTAKCERIAFLKKIEQKDSWVLEGNFLNTIDRQLEIATTVILLDFPRLVCIWRVFKRRFLQPGFKRPDVAPGLPDKITWKFLKSIWQYPDNDSKILQCKVENISANIIKLHNPREVYCFLEHLQRTKILSK